MNTPRNTLDVPGRLELITRPSTVGQCQMIVEGYNRWVKGDSYLGGFTTALPPKTRVIGPQQLDLDLASIDEDDGRTYAVTTSRSYHPGGVNVLVGDANIRFIENSVNDQTWRAPGTIAWAEVVSADAF